MTESEFFNHVNSRVWTWDQQLETPNKIVTRYFDKNGKLFAYMSKSIDKPSEILWWIVDNAE